MTAIPHHPPAAGLVSERLLAPLRQVARRQWAVLAARGGLQTAVVVFAAALPVALLFGFVPDLAVGLRVIIAAALWIALVVAAVRFLRPALRRRRLAYAAIAVERRLDLQERISSAVELSEETDPRFAGSPELLAHLVRQAERDVATINPAAVVPAKPVVQRWSLALAPALVVWLVLLSLWPRPVLRGLYFTLMPWRSMPALLADVSVKPGDVRVPAGDSVDFAATVGRTGSAPARAVTAKLFARSASGQLTEYALQPTGPREFALRMEEVRQSFAYRVRSSEGDSPEGDSPWYRVTVIPRPAIVSLDVHYDYPAYTGLPPGDQKNADGAIAGVVGTHATLTVHATAPIDTAKSHLLINEGRRDEWVEPLTLVPGTASDYEARVRVRNSGPYRIQLVNAEGTANRDGGPHPIAAADDREPTVAIVEPAESEVKVRPDDAVPLRFAASDDFAVVRVEAVVQVDDGPEQAANVDLSKFADRRHVNGEHRVSLPALLKQQGVSPERARKVTYWFRATDSRDPDPQTRESAHHTLVIDRSLNEPFALRDIHERQKDLQEAIRQAIDRLNQAEPQANDLRNAGKDRDDDENWVHDARDRADKATDLLGTTSRDLAKAADENLGTGFDAVAAAAKEVAVGPVQNAADQMGRAALGVGRHAARSKSAGDAQKRIVEARKRLEDLLKKVDAAAAESEAAALVQDVAEKQQQLADAVEQSPPPPDAENPNNAELNDTERQRQQELIGQLEQAVARSEALRPSDAVKAAQKLAELTEKVQRAREQQNQIAKRTDRQAEAVAAEGRAAEMARRQRELNRQVRDFALADQPNLQRAEAGVPDPNQLAEIVRELQQGNPNRAADLQRESANGLTEAADRLRRFAARQDPLPTDARRVALDAAQRNAQRAEQSAGEAKQAGEQLRESAKGDNAGQKSESAKRAAEVARQVAKQAEQAAAAAEDQAQGAIATARAAEADQKAAERSAEAGDADAPVKEAARAASQVAKAAVQKASEARQSAEAAVRSARKAQESARSAEQAAKDGNADRAAEQLVQAGDALHEAQRRNEQAAKDGALAEQEVAALDASARAAALAANQQALADLTQPVADALAKARQDLPGPDDLGGQAKQVGQEAQQAAQLAGQLGQMAQSQRAADLAERAGAAEGSLKGAAESARAMAAAEKRVAAQQQAAQAARQKAAQAEAAAQDAARQSAEAKQQAGVLRQQAKAAEQAGDANGAKELNKRVAQAEERSAKASRQAEQSRQQASAQADQAAAAAKSAESAQADAAGAQGKTGEALAQALQALRGVPDEATAANDEAESNAADGATGRNGKRASASGESPGNSGEGTDAARPGPASAKEAMARAARQVQEGLNAQRQAMQNMPMAARQAAKAINEAAQSMASAHANAAAQGASQSQGQGAAAQGQATGQGSVAAAGQPGQTADSRRGVVLGGGGAESAAPAPVQALGVSSDDWAKLPPQLQRDLLNAAQQTGPPSYREMIRNYYVRLARLPRAEPEVK